MAKGEKIIGIDLGTTNSVVAVRFAVSIRMINGEKFRLGNPTTGALTAVSLDRSRFECGPISSDIFSAALNTSSPHKAFRWPFFDFVSVGKHRAVLFAEVGLL